MTQPPSPKPRKARTVATGGGDATASGVNFQQSLGALLGLWMLTETAVDHRLELGAATITAIRMETEAPLDDALAITSAGGIIAAQAKNALSLSDSLMSEFGKTVDQIVRQWRLCKDGAGDLGWNRPLDQVKDRLMIVVGPDSPATTRVNLARALNARRQPGAAILTVQETKALKQFDACLRQAWATATSDSLTDDVLAAISKLTFVLTLDPGGADRAAWTAALGPALASPADAPATLNLLERVAGDLMSARAGRTVTTLRSDLLNRGARLAARPDYRDDIAKLTAFSRQTAQTLAALEVVEAETGSPIGITRECQPAVTAAALGGDLLLIGEPGAGKSAVINTLGRALRDQGHDVVQLAVDRFSVESLEGLSRALDLQHELPAVLGAWDGPGPAFLLIDALDASRGGAGEAAFRRLIESAIELGGRWTVVASIRTFDLRLGLTFRALFRGTPPDVNLRGEGFGQVRHIQIPTWSNAEFNEVLAFAPRLAEVVKHTGAKLRDLAMVPFNTRLLAELVATGAVSQDFDAIDSQIALLDLYWDRRVRRLGVAAEVCLRAVVDEMVAVRALRAPRLKVAAANANILETLTAEGVLVVTNRERSVQFRHHLLFDYVASRVFLDADDIVAGTTTFPKADGMGLVVAPALGFLLQSLWAEDADHERFWIAVSQLLGGTNCDPVIRSVAAKMAAELPATASHIETFARAVNAGQPAATTALSHVVGAAAIKLEDDPSTSLAPWVNLELQLSAKPAPVAGVLRMLGFMLIDRVKDPLQRTDLGKAARALLAHGYTLDDSRHLAAPAIGFVADTLDTDVARSVALLREALTKSRFDRFASEELPALAHKISKIATASPGFAVEVFECAFAGDVSDNRTTSMGNSQILRLTSNARQDFELARYSLKEYFPQFLAASPTHATRALLAAICGFVARQHPISEGLSEATFSVAGIDVRLQPDHSHIWAHEAHPSYAQDADALLSQFVTWLETAEEQLVQAAADYAVRNATFAVVWSRLFMAASARGGALARLLVPFAQKLEFLISPDTRKDAIDLVASQYDALRPEEREALEDAVLQRSFDDYVHPDLARTGFLGRLFGAIGVENLATEAAKSILAAAAPEATSNERLFAITTASISDDYYWLNPAAKSDPVVRDAINEVDALRSTLGMEPGGKTPIESVETALADLGALKARLDAGEVSDDNLVHRMEGTFAQGLHKVVQSDALTTETSRAIVSQVVSWISDASGFANPEVGDDTEADFERGASWSSPSARFEAAEAALDLVLKRPEVYPHLAPVFDRMLADPHPAVRMAAATRLVRIWDLDREGFWARARRVIAEEQNLGVLNIFITQTMGTLVWHGAAREVADLVLPLNDRLGSSPAREHGIRDHLIQMTLQFWMRFQFSDAEDHVRAWFAQAIENVEEVRTAIHWLRNDYTAGLRGPEDAGPARRKIAIDLLVQAVFQAAAVLGPFATFSAPTEGEIARARVAMQISDTACQQLYFSSGVFQHGDQDKRPPLTPEGAAVFLHETTPILRLIGESGGPHTVYYLIQLLEHLVEADPAGVFDLITSAILRGGQQSGYQFESLAADLMVKLVGRYLADHKDIFDDPQRRTALVDTLEVFVAAGWPSVRRLFYRLPDLLH